MKIRRSYLFGVIVRDRKDKLRIDEAAELAEALSTAEYIRNLINEDFKKRGLKPLKRVSLRRAQCMRGHPYNRANTLWRKVNGRKWKICRVCKRIKEKEYYHNVRKKNATKQGVSRISRQNEGNSC